jgi:hypothetical protein
MQPTWQGCPAHRFVAFAAVLLAAASAASPARAQLRIVTYNTNNASSSSSGPRADAATVFTALGDQAKAGFARPADIVLFQEHAAVATSTQAYVNLLNGIYGAGTYARGSLDGATSGGGRPTVVYKTSAVTLVGETAVNSTSTSGAARATLRYQFRPVGYDSAADFYVYNSHFKASNDSTSRARRGVEADGIRANADALGAGVAAIYAGDFNFYTSSEAGFGNFTAAGHGQAFDPINRVGSWTNSSSFRDVHTQSPVTASQFNGQITGGMDDRFDFQLVTGAVLDGRGFDYLPGSYWAFGNTGTHTLDGALSTGSAAALQALLPGPSDSDWEEFDAARTLGLISGPEGLMNHAEQFWSDETLELLSRLPLESGSDWFELNMQAWLDTVTLRRSAVVSLISPMNPAGSEPRIVLSLPIVD